MMSQQPRRPSSGAHRAGAAVLILALSALGRPLAAQRPAPTARPAQTNAGARGQRVDSVRVSWVPDPRAASDGRVADPAHHLSAATVAALNDTIRQLERETGVQMAVVVVDSTAGLEPSDFALNLLRYWGVGSRERNDGMLFLWVPARRSVHVTVGDGLEGILPDARVGRIQDQEVVPAFRRGAFDEGVMRGVRALAAAAREEFGRPRQAEAAPGAAPGAAPARIVAPPPASRRGNGALLIALFSIGAVGLAGVGWVIARSRRPPQCPDGHGPMRLVPEEQEDQFLSRPEQVEESVGSVDHKVWLCDTCGIRRTIADKRWFTPYRDCPSCGRRTLASETRTLQHATTFSEGTQLVSERCANCGHANQYERAIPRIATSSGSGGSSPSFGGGSSGGSSGGGGSSWGGGSSRGGGAGRSY